MKLEKILSNLNSLEKNSFIKIIDNIISEQPKNYKQIEKILSESEGSGLKNMDNIVITRIFDLVKDEFAEVIKAEFVDASSQLDVFTDIIIRDGNCIMKREWFLKLYEEELKHLNKKIKSLEKELDSNKSDIVDGRLRDYKIYRACVDTAFHNDLEHNRETKITDDELSILLTLAKRLELSQEETKLINYMIVPTEKMDIDDAISELKNLGVAFYSKKYNTIYVADEMVRVLRKVRNKEIADKFFRRVLRLMREPQINLICRKHNIDWKKDLNWKIKEIIKEGISFSGVLGSDAHKDGTSLSDIKKFLNTLWNDKMKMSGTLKGSTIEDKIDSLIEYFDHIEKDEKVGISVDGYEKLLRDIADDLPKLNKTVREEFEIQDELVLQSSLLLDYNIKPRDILDIMTSSELQKFCKKQDISTRGNEVFNILDAYKDSENLYLENYEAIGYRDLNLLKENGIKIKEAELGLKFEDLTKTIFEQLGFNVDEELKRTINTKKDQIDIVLNLGNNDLILVECKTVKESGYNKFSSVSRQLKSYSKLVKSNDFKVAKTLLIAPEFSDEFINDTELEYDLNLSLIRAASLSKILDAFKHSSKHEKFPYKLLMRDVLIQEDRIIKAICKN